MNAQQLWTAYTTILVKEVLRFARIWVQTIIPPVITTALYFVIFGNLIGSQIGDMEGHRYIDFITPGLIMMTVITNAYANVVSSFYGSKFQGNVAEMLVSPMPNWIILAGFVSGGVARGLAVGLAVTLVSLFFSTLSVQHIFITFTIVLLTSVLFSLAGVINAVYAKSFDDITIIPTFVLTPLTYLGGVFYSIAMLSPLWQNISLLNPVLYMVNGFRYGILGASDMSIWLSYSVIMGFILLLGGFSLYLLNKGIGIRS
ncbi:ABC-2 type transport system permease protein [Thiothrix caldifontis]|jgi:ABC-type polysaccharide/polyol phosphate export systems, permease component|uniref:Transport permease protein n=1 Tax=Thiothrix caldifontis TaxID=525918 RepID=A0A1H4FQ42_9GAMM|nr:ABC transporter permease [Thiothrix caldifontis]SEA98632.1 ABC-2 type transport system permease protein [Thiothrix caldifontis]